jgi:hypothetical protein
VALCFVQAAPLALVQSVSSSPALEAYGLCAHARPLERFRFPELDNLQRENPKDRSPMARGALSVLSACPAPPRISQGNWRYLEVPRGTSLAVLIESGHDSKERPTRRPAVPHSLTQPRGDGASDGNGSERAPTSRGGDGGTRARVQPQRRAHGVLPSMASPLSQGLHAPPPSGRAGPGKQAETERISSPYSNMPRFYVSRLQLACLL